jgi:hypothetical protein
MPNQAYGRERLFVSVGEFSLEAWTALQATFGWKYPGWPVSKLQTQMRVSLKSS